MTNEEDISRKEMNGKVLDAVGENIEILEETDMDSLGKMNAHLLNITMVLCDMSRSLAFIADKEYESEWQEITYAGGSIEPKDIYICKNCNYQADIEYHYCSNCGALMRNGKTRIYYSGKIKISE